MSFRCRAKDCIECKIFYIKKTVIIWYMNIGVGIIWYILNVNIIKKYKTRSSSLISEMIKHYHKFPGMVIIFSFAITFHVNTGHSSSKQYPWTMSYVNSIESWTNVNLNRTSNDVASMSFPVWRTDNCIIIYLRVAYTTFLISLVRM